MERIKVKMQELKAGDVIQLFEGAYGTATVKQVKDGMVSVFRPYTHTADFSYSGNRVICYVGIEIYNLVAGEHVYELFNMVDLK